MTNEELYEALDKPKVVITLEEYERLRTCQSKLLKAECFIGNGQTHDALDLLINDSIVRSAEEGLHESI